MKRMLFAALAASTFVAVPAHAETVTFNGNRAVECSVTGYSGTINFGNLGRNGEASPVNDGGIDVFCNQPFAVSLVSTNGYLKLNTTDAGNDSNSENDLTSQDNPMFAAGLNYGLVIPSFVQPQGSQHLTAGNSVGVANLPALYANGLTAIYDTVESSKPLLGGTYSDTVTLTLTPNGV